MNSQSTTNVLLAVVAVCLVVITVGLITGESIDAQEVEMGSYSRPMHVKLSGLSSVIVSGSVSIDGLVSVCDTCQHSDTPSFTDILLDNK